MLWVFVFGGIALVGLVMLVAYAVWLMHKASDLMSEFGQLGARAGELADLVAQIQPPAAGGSSAAGPAFTTTALPVQRATEQADVG